jgi:hypothetical protein
LWVVVLPIHLLQSMTDACQGMNIGLNLRQLDRYFPAFCSLRETHLLVYGEVRKGTLAKRTHTALTTGGAETLLAEFTQFRSPLTAVLDQPLDASVRPGPDGNRLPLDFRCVISIGSPCGS